MAVPLAKVKAFLKAHNVDYADLFERSELIARYDELRGRLATRKEVRLRGKANRAQQRQSYELAVRLYTDALSVSPISPTLQAQLFANRSTAYYGCGLADAALKDACASLRLDSEYVKGHNRKGVAELQLGRSQEAAETFRQALEIVDGLAKTANASGVEADADAKKQATAWQGWQTSLAEKLEQALTLQTASLKKAVAKSEAGAGAGLPTDTGGVEAEGGLLEKLDDDLIHEVFSHLDAKAACAAAAACAAFARAASSQLTWQAKCMQTFGDLCTLLAGGASELAAGGALASGGSGLNSNSNFGPARDWRVLFRERTLHARHWEKGTPVNVTHLGVHSGPVYGVSMRGDLLASSSEDGQVCLYDLATSRVVHSLRDHGTGILGVWLDPSCQRLLSGGFDATIKVWRLTAMDGSAEEGLPLAVPRVERNVTGHLGPIVSCMGTDSHILSTSFDGTLGSWDWGGRPVHAYEAHAGHACGLATDESGKTVYTGGDDGVLNAWDLRLEKCSDSSASLELAHGGSVWAIAAQGNLVVAGATGGLLALWDIRKGLSSLPLASAHDAHSDAIAGLQFIADGRTLVSSSFDSTVRLWDVPRLLADATPLGGSVSPTGTMLRGLRATIPVGNLSRCTRVVADDTRIIVGCIGRHLAIIDMV